MALATTVARRFYSVGSRRAKVTTDPAEAVLAVEAGTPVVLVGKDAALLGEAVSGSPDRGGRERLLAVVVGDPADPVVMSAAEEMAGELWQWAKDRPGQDRPGQDRPGRDRPSG